MRPAMGPALAVSPSWSAIRSLERRGLPCQTPDGGELPARDASEGVGRGRRSPWRRKLTAHSLHALNRNMGHPLVDARWEDGGGRLTLIYENVAEGTPATHAVVIGVGGYPWLLGGAEAADPRLAEGMGQLSSPPASARAIADWLVSSHADPAAPLATVDLLLSDATGDRDYVRPDGTVFKGVELPDQAALKRAIRAWRVRCDSNPGNLALFFFCGHGVGRGFELAMLPRDFGSEPMQPFEHSVSFEGMKEAMRSCAATRQLFFVDACRVHSPNLMADYAAQPDPVMAVRTPFTVGLRQSVYFATTSGAPAFGRPGRPSLFTENLLKGLRGLGANDNRGEWWVETTGLQRALTGLAEEFADEDDKGLQVPTSGEQTSFDFQRLAEPPVVPLYLHPTWTEEGESPPDDLAAVALHSEGAPVLDWPSPWADSPECSWRGDRFRSDRAAGARYSWSVSFTDGRTMSSAPATLSPPFRIVEFPRDGLA